MTRRAPRRIATLWQLAWNDDRLSCAIYRSEAGLEFRLESGRGTVLAAPFDIGPRAIARTDALKRSLQRRGWREERAPRSI